MEATKLLVEFCDRNKVSRVVQLSVNLACDLTEEFDLPLQHFFPHKLNMKQSLRVAYVGTRNCVFARDSKETFEQFCDALEGPALAAAVEAANNAVINFSLRNLPPKAVKALQAEIDRARAEFSALGRGATPSESSPSPDSTPSDTA